MSNTSNDTSILTIDDGALIITSIVAAAGPEGIAQPELLRQADLISRHVADWKTGAGLYELFSQGLIRLSLNDDETDVMVTESEPDYPARKTP